MPCVIAWAAPGPAAPLPLAFASPTQQHWSGGHEFPAGQAAWPSLLRLSKSMPPVGTKAFRPSRRQAAPSARNLGADSTAYTARWPSERSWLHSEPRWRSSRGSEARRRPTKGRMRSLPRWSELQRATGKERSSFKALTFSHDRFRRNRR